MKRSTPAAGGKSATPATGWFRIPKGFEGAGRRTTEDKYRNHYEPALKAQAARTRKDEKNRKEREKRAARRAERQKHSLTTHRDEYSGWGTANTSAIREGQVVRFHGAYKVTMTGADVTRILNMVGSDQAKPRDLGDGNYEVILTPGLGDATATEMLGDENGPGLIDQYGAEYFMKKYGGTHVEFLGAFWRPSGKAK